MKWILNLTTSEMFQNFLSNIKIDNAEQISTRYDEITACLNKNFRNTDSKTANSLQVGSYGRWTAIKGVSDLDMLYIMPKSHWDNYKNGNQSQLLTEVKDAIKAKYTKTNVFVDRLVVRVLFKNFHVEVQPVFEDDGSFQYPDTYNGGSWKITKPQAEINAMRDFDSEKNKNLRRLCKMVRAWKNKHGVGMGGLLIDSLAYNFLKSTNNYDEKSFNSYGLMSRDFFKYLSEQPNQEYYAALGSGQRVKVKKKFQQKAKKAYELCLMAINEGDSDSAHDKWKKIYGRPFPAKSIVLGEALFNRLEQKWSDTEQFIEDYHPIDIRYDIKLECEVSQNGFRENYLTKMLARGIPLLANKKLLFSISFNNVPEPYSIKWKVLNRGLEAQKRNCIRGQIFSGNGHHRLNESTTFKGEHIVECYIIKNDVVVAKDRIDVPIQ